MRKIRLLTMALLSVATVSAAFAVPATSERGAAAERDTPRPEAGSLPNTAAVVARLAQTLNSDSFAEREAAMLELAKLGDAAAAEIARRLDVRDAEVQWRLRTALAMIRWDISPDIYAECVPLLADYEQLEWTERQMRLREISAAGRKPAIPTLVAILRAEKDDRVRRTIARILASRNMWPDGLSALRQLKVPGVDMGALLDPRVLVSIGNAFLKAGDYDRALREYERAIKLMPNEPVVLYNIACIYALRGKADEAFRYLARSIRAGYDDVEWLERDPDLKGLHDDPRFQQMVEMIRRVKATGAPAPGPEPEAAPQSDPAE